MKLSINIPNDTFYVQDSRCLYFKPQVYDKLNQIITGNSVSLANDYTLEAAIYRSISTAFEEEIYKSIFEKGAALLEAIITHHAFLDGNKRTGWEATKFFLRLNLKKPYQYYTDEAEKFVLDIATKSIKFDKIVNFLEKTFNK